MQDVSELAYKQLSQARSQMLEAYPEEAPSIFNDLAKENNFANDRVLMDAIDNARGILLEGPRSRRDARTSERQSGIWDNFVAMLIGTHTTLKTPTVISVLLGQK